MIKRPLILASICALTAVAMPAVSKKQVFTKDNVRLESHGKCSSPVYNSKNVTFDCRGVDEKALKKLDKRRRRDHRKLAAQLARENRQLRNSITATRKDVTELKGMMSALLKSRRGQDKTRTDKQNKAQSKENRALKEKYKRLRLRLKKKEQALNALRVKHENTKKETTGLELTAKKNEEYKQQIEALTALVRNLKTNSSIGTQADRDKIIRLINAGKFTRATRKLKGLQSGQGKKQKGRRFYLLGNAYLVNRKYRKALAAYQQATLHDPKNALYWSMSAQTNYLLRQFITAQAESQRAIKLDPVGTAADHERIGKVNFLRNYYTKAAQNYKRALKLRKQHPKRYRSKIALGRLHNLLGNTLLSANRLKPAARQFNLAIRAYKPLLPADHTSMGLVYSNLGTTYNRLYKYNNALVYMKKAADIYRKAWGPQSVSLAHIINNIGLIYYDTRRFHQAIRYYEKALAVYREKLSANSDSITIAYVNIGLAYHYSKQYSKAERFLKSAITLYESRNGKYKPFLVRTYKYLGNAYLSQKKYREAKTAFDQSLLIARRFPKIPSIQIARIHNAAGLAHNYLNLTTRAIAHYRSAIALFKKAGLYRSSEYAVFYFNAGIACIRKRDYRTAHAWFKQSYKLARRSLRPSSPALRIYKKYVTLSRRMIGARPSGKPTKNIDSYNPSAVNNHQSRQSDYIESLRWSMREIR